jgi:hypothetical protein
MSTSPKRIWIHFMDKATPIGIWISDTLALSHAWYYSLLALWLHGRLVSNPRLHWVQHSPNSLWQVTLVTLVYSFVWFLMIYFNINVQQQPYMKITMHAEWLQIRHRPLARCVMSQFVYFALQDWTEKNSIALMAFASNVNASDMFTNQVGNILFACHNDHISDRSLTFFLSPDIRLDPGASVSVSCWSSEYPATSFEIHSLV